MFTERFNELLSEVCRTSTGEFARITGYDRSYVSHLRNGDRTPKSARASSARLVRAVCACAAEKQAVEALRERVGAPPGAQDAALHDAVMGWLFEAQGEEKNAAHGQDAKRRRRRSSFGSRLELAMELANVSAMRLARSVNVDASLIAKYRSGLRVPQMNHPIIRSLAAALSARIYALERTAGLARLIGATREELAGESEGSRLLEAWLRDYRTVDTSLIENFLEGMDAFSPDAKPLRLSAESAVDDAARNDRSEFYTGSEGLRRAVLRFLSDAVRNGWRELWLYSDQSMDWLIGEPEFAVRWAALMNAYVGGGGRIRIIHNVDRGLEEMIAAIRNWMPLYISGEIESWYSLQSGGERFFHTLFFAPEGAGIVGIGVAGKESRTCYRYAVRAEELAHVRDMFDDLLTQCRPLLNMSREGVIGKLPVVIKDRDVHLVERSISLGTMPETLLRRILRRASLPGQTERTILADWAGRRELMLETIARGALHECIVLPEEAALYGGRVAVDTVYAPLFYTPEEYGEHLRAIWELSGQEQGYRIYPLSEPPFERIKLVASKRMAVIVYSSGYPITFTTAHPLMCRAFADFAGRLEEHGGMDRHMLEGRLKQYF